VVLPIAIEFEAGGRARRRCGKRVLRQRLRTEPPWRKRRARGSADEHVTVHVELAADQIGGVSPNRDRMPRSRSPRVRPAMRVRLSSSRKSISTWSARSPGKRCSNAGTIRSSARGMHPTRKCQRPFRAISCSRVTSAAMRRATCSASAPTGVARLPRAERSNRRAPKRSSASRSSRDRAGWEVPSVPAA